MRRWYNRDMNTDRAFTAAALAALLLGCSSAPHGFDVTPVPAEWEDATAIVWRDVFDQSAEPPELILVTGSSLDCDGRLYRVPEGCAGGSFYGELWQFTIAAPPDMTPSASSLAHELWHAVQHLRGGPGAHDEELYAQARRGQAALRDAGL